MNHENTKEIRFFFSWGISKHLNKKVFDVGRWIDRFWLNKQRLKTWDPRQSDLKPEMEEWWNWTFQEYFFNLLKFSYLKSFFSRVLHQRDILNYIMHLEIHRSSNSRSKTRKCMEKKRVVLNLKQTPLNQNCSWNSTQKADANGILCTASI